MGWGLSGRERGTHIQIKKVVKEVLWVHKVFIMIYFFIEFVYLTQYQNNLYEILLLVP